MPAWQLVLCCKKHRFERQSQYENLLLAEILRYFAKWIRNYSNVQLDQYHPLKYRKSDSEWRKILLRFQIQDKFVLNAISM